MSDHRVMRKNKTRQDRIDAGRRDRVQEWDRHRSWGQNHKPSNSKDWLSYRKHED